MSKHIEVIPHTNPTYDIVAWTKKGANKPVGFFKVEACENGTIGVILYMFIRRKYRNLGYASEILKGCKETFKTLATQVSSSTKESQTWLKKMGFSVEGDLLVWRGPKDVLKPLFQPERKNVPEPFPSNKNSMPGLTSLLQ